MFYYFNLICCLFFCYFHNAQKKLCRSFFLNFKQCLCHVCMGPGPKNRIDNASTAAEQWALYFLIPSDDNNCQYFSLFCCWCWLMSDSEHKRAAISEEGFLYSLWWCTSWIRCFYRLSNAVYFIESNKIGNNFYLFPKKKRRNNLLMAKICHRSGKIS